jgi:hypothetical protein
MVKTNFYIIFVLIFFISISCFGSIFFSKSEGLISNINDDFQRPRAYFHPFTTDYESYSYHWLPPWDPREKRDQEKLISDILSR